jgi:hypothetical protein
MLQSFLGWLLIVFGLATLSEGYYVLRQRADRRGRKAGLWWGAGLIWALGLLAIRYGLVVKGC